MATSLKIVLCESEQQAEPYLKMGYCLVGLEPNGRVRVVYRRGLRFDGDLATLSGAAAIYSNNFGWFRDSLEFAIVGATDAIKSLCVAILAGLVPHPEFPNAPPRRESAMTRNVSALVDFVDRLGESMVISGESKEGRLLRGWTELTGQYDEGPFSFAGAVFAWCRLLCEGQPAPRCE